MLGPEKFSYLAGCTDIRGRSRSQLGHLAPDFLPYPRFPEDSSDCGASGPGAPLGAALLLSSPASSPGHMRGPSLPVAQDPLPEGATLLGLSILAPVLRI